LVARGRGAIKVDLGKGCAKNKKRNTTLDQEGHPKGLGREGGWRARLGKLARKDDEKDRNWLKWEGSEKVPAIAGERNRVKRP